MLEGEKILITGPAGAIAFAIAKDLASRNEVWGIARFSDPATRKEVEDVGVKTARVDLENPDFSELPDDFTYLLHLAVSYEPFDYDRAIRVDAEGTGLLLAHCRSVKAALVMSTNGVYLPHEDPLYAYTEGDPLGDMIVSPIRPYSVAKISQEAVARFCSRHFNMPMVIARMNSAYSPRGGLPLEHMRAIAAGQPVRARWDPLPYSPIFETDIVAQVEPLLRAATVPCNVVNWCGDEIVSVQEWAAYAAELLGTSANIIVAAPPSGASRGVAANPDKRRSITGPCQVGWKEGFRRTVAAAFPDRVDPQRAEA